MKTKNIKTIVVKDKATLDRLYADSALSVEGLSPDKANIGEFVKWVEKLTPMVRREVYVIDGKTMNSAYGLTGTNAYPTKDFNIVCIMLSDMVNSAPTFLARFDIGGRWFDDIVNNNAEREERRATA